MATLGALFVVAMSVLVVMGLYSLWRLWRRSRIRAQTERTKRTGRLRHSEEYQLKERGLLDHALMVHLNEIKRRDGHIALHAEVDRLLDAFPVLKRGTRLGGITDEAVTSHRIASQRAHRENAREQNDQTLDRQR